MISKETQKLFFESFRTASIASTISKILDVLNEDSGDFTASAALTFSFSRKGKRLEGYYAFGSSRVLRFEFYKDQLASVSVWNIGDSLGEKPRFIVQIRSSEALDAAKQIAEAITSGGASAEPTLEEAKEFHSTALQEAAKEDIKRFVDEQGDTGGSFSGMYRSYLKWAEQNGLRPVSDSTFISNLRAIRGRTGVGISSQTPAVRVVPGVPDDAAPEPPEYDDFELEVLNNTVLYKYEMMAEITKRIVTWDPLYKNAFIYGVGGVGKTFTVEQIVSKFAKPEGVETFKGAISGFTGLLQIMWENRQKKVIIFDDNDGLLDNANALNMLKVAMENTDPRIVSYMRFKKGGASAKEKGIVVDVSRLHEKLVSIYANGELLCEEAISKEEAAWYARESGMRIDRHPMREADVEDYDPDDFAEEDLEYGDLDPSVDPAYGEDPDAVVPDKFQFTSRIIFISNLMKVPQPMLDRCISIGLLLTKEQILDLIESKLEFIMKKEAPEISLELKKEVLAFMRQYVHRIGKPLTFRLFMQLCALFYSGHPEAKKMAYMTMRGDGMKTTLR